MFLFDAFAEDFQEQETMFSGMMCKQEVLKDDIHYYCGNNFHHMMEFVDPEDWCVFKDIIGYEPRPFLQAKLQYTISQHKKTLGRKFKKNN